MTLPDAIEKSFLSTVEQFYTEADQKRGYLSFPEDSGEFRKVDFMRPSIAIVTVGPGMFASVEDLAGEVTKTKFQVRRRTRSGLFPMPPDFVKKP